MKSTFLYFLPKFPFWNFYWKNNKIVTLDFEKFISPSFSWINAATKFCPPRFWKIHSSPTFWWFGAAARFVIDAVLEDFSKMLQDSESFRQVEIEIIERRLEGITALCPFSWSKVILFSGLLLLPFSGTLI